MKELALKASVLVLSFGFAFHTAGADDTPQSLKQVAAVGQGYEDNFNGSAAAGGAAFKTVTAGKIGPGSGGFFWVQGEASATVGENQPWGKFVNGMLVFSGAIAPLKAPLGKTCGLYSGLSADGDLIAYSFFNSGRSGAAEVEGGLEAGLQCNIQKTLLTAGAVGRLTASLDVADVGGSGAGQLMHGVAAGVVTRAAIDNTVFATLRIERLVSEPVPFDNGEEGELAVDVKPLKRAAIVIGGDVKVVRDDPFAGIIPAVVAGQAQGTVGVAF